MKINSKINLMGVSFVLVSAVAFIGIVSIQKGILRNQIQRIIRDQAETETGALVRSLYQQCTASDARTQRELDFNARVARGAFERAGQAHFETNLVSWTAVNQLTKEPTHVMLPQFFVGDKWLGQNSRTNVGSPLVDDVQEATGCHMTIFQRLNEQGDMLRVCTTVRAQDGSRAVGTFIPRQNPDGTENAILSAILRGETYRGHAFVVNQWHAAQYDPIWNATRTRIIGMLYVGLGLSEIARDLEQSFSAISLGKSGYVFVLGAKGEQKGTYLLSRKGERDGQNVWNVKDTDGHYPIQSMIEKALQTKEGSVGYVHYAWANNDEAHARQKYAAVTYFAPLDWVIAAGTYEDDYGGFIESVQQSLARLLAWVMATALFLGVAALLCSRWISGSITRPIERMISLLQLNSQQSLGSASQLASSSQALAEGANQQAASLEETSTSLEQMSSTTQQTASNAQRTNALATNARETAEAGALDMQKMTAAMEEIKGAGDDIAKIIKTIDQIAFQTNILALNAAVEAARAGEAGQGFAVVAQEVRSLAQRSAEAAKETAEKLQATIAKTEQGFNISTKVEKALAEIVAQARRVNELSAEVATASREQSQGIVQVNSAMAQMGKVIQVNAAHAEETASAAQEVKAQAGAIESSVADLVKLIGGKRAAQDQPSHSVAAVKRPPQPPLSVRPPAGLRQMVSN